MTYQHDFTQPTELLQQGGSQGLGILSELIRVMIIAALLVERQQFLGVNQLVHSPEQRAYVNGFKPKIGKS